MNRKTTSIVLIFYFFVGMSSAFPGDDDTMQEYPDGGYGMSFEGGYQQMPDGQVIPPAGYRDPYMDTQYGLLTEEGAFNNFPGFNLPGSSAAAAQEAEKTDRLKEKTKELKFYAATTSSAGSLYWGVYDPSAEKK